MAKIKDYVYQESDKEYENANNEELKKILIQLQAIITDFEIRIKALENK